MLVVKRWLADDKPQQILCICSEQRMRKVLSDTMGVQPAGVAPRKVLSTDTKKNLRTEAPKLKTLRFISDECAEYLLRYADGTLSLPRRPQQYKFLNRRLDRKPDVVSTDTVTYDSEEDRCCVSIKSVDGDFADVFDPQEGEDEPHVQMDTALS